MTGITFYQDALADLTQKGYATGKELLPFIVKEFRFHHNGESYPKRALIDGSTWGYSDEDGVWTPDQDGYSF